MTIVEMGQQAPGKGAIEQSFELFLRVMAVIAMVSGLSYWAAITGLFADSAMRFDQADVATRSFGSAMAMLMPTAALGLWLAARWGLVLWVVAASAEIIAVSAMAIPVPQAAIVVVANIAGLAIIIAWTGAVLLERRAARLRAR